MSDKIYVNTGNLQSYVSRLNKVRSRASDLHSRVRRLYWSDEVSGIYDLYRTNRFSSGIQTMQKVQNAVSDLISDIETVENYFAKADPLNFTAPGGQLISAVSAADRGAAGTKKALNTAQVLYAAANVASVGAKGQVLASKKGTSAWQYFDVDDILLDSAKAGRSIYDVYKKGFFNSGFRVEQVGDYYRVYGKNGTWKTTPGFPLEDIKGRRYKVGSEKTVKSGVAAYASNSSAATKFTSALKANFSGNFLKETYTGKGSILGYLKTAYETVTGIVGNVKSGASVAKIAADATTDIAKGLGSMAAAAVGAKVGAAIGTCIPIPVVGTAVGALVGGVIGSAVGGAIYNGVVDGIKIGGKTVAGWVSTGLETAYTAVGNAVKSGAKAVASVANAAKNAISGAAKSVGNFFKKLF